MNKFKNSSEYYEYHKCCPTCYCDKTCQTLVGYIWNPDVEFIDNNEAECGNCQWVGTVHDLVPSQIKKVKLTGEQIDILMRVADLKLAMNTELRNGQALFNALFALHPEIAKEVTGTDNDCFYDDKKIGDLLRHLIYEEPKK